MITETLSSLANSSLASSAALAASSTDSFADSAAVRYSSQGFCSSSALSRLVSAGPCSPIPAVPKCRETALLPDVQWYDSLSQIHRPPETAGPSGDGSLPLSKILFPCRCSLLLSQPRAPPVSATVCSALPRRFPHRRSPVGIRSPARLEPGDHTLSVL